MDHDLITFRKLRSRHWNKVAIQYSKHPSLGVHYERELEHYYKLIVPPVKCVLNPGSGIGWIDSICSLESS